MAVLHKSKQLRKELSLFNVYAIATGTTLSAGFFLLPGLAAAYAGPAIVLAYVIAVIPLLPAVFSIVELATAMPRAGGVYYFLDRTLGPSVGTIGGLGTWLVLLLKVAFALVGFGAYLHYLWPHLPVKPIVVGLAVALTGVNLIGTRRTGGFQVGMVVGLLAILAVFIFGGAPSIDPARFKGFFDAGWPTIFSTAGFVYISYIGITSVASLSEEVRDPERNLPKGIFLSLITAVFVYAVGTAIMVGVLPLDRLIGDLTPAATAAETIFGRWGGVLLSVAALLAFTSVANAGILSASRYPLALSRDHLMPRVFATLGWHKIPYVALGVTVALIIVSVLFLDAVKIAKLASSFQLLMFALVCLAVIVMRESRIDSYDPGYRSPFYPWMQIVGVIAPVFFIAQMGWESILFTAGLFILGMVWFRTYGLNRVARDGAIYHVFERWGRMRYEGLDRELRGIMKEKGLREEDPFDEIVARSFVVDALDEEGFEQLVVRASESLAGRVPLTAAELERRFMQGTLIGATPVTHGVALPHLRLEGIQHAELVLVRARRGISIHIENPLLQREDDRTVEALFFLVSPEGDPAQHLRILAQIAGHVEDEKFSTSWRSALGETELKEVLLRDERFLTIHLGRDEKTAFMAGRTLREIEVPEGSLIALIKRGGEIVVPRGSTRLEHGDRLTVIGSAVGIREFQERYGG